MPRLSILIPWLDLTPQFEATLASVLQNRPADSEVVVAHAVEYNDPYALGDEVRFVHVPDQRTITGLINQTLPTLSGEIIHLLGCGVEVCEHWTEPALAHFHDPEVAAVSPVVRRPNGCTAGVTLLGGARRGSVPLGNSADAAVLESQIAGPSIDAAFYHRDVIVAFEGFDESIGDELADLDLALAIKDIGLKSVVEASLPLTGLNVASSPVSQGVVGGTEAERFYRRHSGRCSSLTRLLHVATAPLGDLASGSPGRTLGRLLAWLDASPLQAHHDRIAAAAAALEQAAAETLSLEAARDQRSATQPVRRAA